MCGEDTDYGRESGFRATHHGRAPTTPGMGRRAPKRIHKACRRGSAKLWGTRRTHPQQSPHAILCSALSAQPLPALISTQPQIQKSWSLHLDGTPGRASRGTRLSTHSMLQPSGLQTTHCRGCVSRNPRRAIQAETALRIRTTSHSTYPAILRAAIWRLTPRATPYPSSNIF